MTTPRRRPILYALITSRRPLSEVKETLARCARVLACGRGSVEDNEALWFELHRLSASAPLNLGVLAHALTPDDCVRAVQDAFEGEGKDLSRQIPLFATRVNGLWSNGVEGGQAPAPEPESEKKAATSDAEQISLFG